MWSESNLMVKNLLKLAKQEIIRKIEEETGMLLDSPTSQGGQYKLRLPYLQDFHCRGKEGVL